MKILKAVVALALVAGAVYFSLRRYYPPYRCNIIVMNVSRNSDIIERSVDSLQIAFGARRNLELLRPCVEAVPQSVAVQMLAGTNHTFLDQHEQALQRYRTAMQWDQRPELHLELGQTLLRLGREQEAYPHLVAACLIHPVWVERLPDQIRAYVNVDIERLRGPESWKLRKKKRGDLPKLGY